MCQPVLEEHCGVMVVRDDLYPGGTKARVFEDLYKTYEEIIYCCAATSCTQVSLATSAKALGKRATVFLAERADQTRQTKAALELGALVHQIRPGYMNVIHARAVEYAQDLNHPSLLASLGFDIPVVIDKLAEVAEAVPFEPDEVWCAAGSGVLTRALQKAWPGAVHCAVQVGKNSDVGHAVRFKHPLDFEKEYEGKTEFPSERHFDAKAWDLCKRYKGRYGDKVLFWNILGNI